MKNVVIVSKPGKAELQEVVPRLAADLKNRGYGVIVDVETAVYLPGHQTIQRSEIAEHSPAFVIVLGGDGTLLAAARSVGKADIPLLPVNLGSLGFLTEVKLAELFDSVDAVVNKKVQTDLRSVIHCEVLRKNDRLSEYEALNDVVITKSTIARMTEVDVLVDGNFVANYKADGVIISTPTGSTAYSLAAGGPVLEPTVAAFVITPVSPHALTNRPLVVRDSAEIEMIVKSTNEEAFLTVDGQSGMPVLEGDRVICRRSGHQIRLLRLPGRTFFDVLRAKLKWGER